MFVYLLIMNIWLEPRMTIVFIFIIIELVVRAPYSIIVQLICLEIVLLTSLLHYDKFLAASHIHN
jgi:hypothetical protein